MTPPVLAELPVWQRIRRYAVPAAMIEACAAARAVGDWRAGCAAGRVDVAFDLAEVRREHGHGQAERIEADLAALAPDLLRWHLPRTLGGRTSLATDQQWLLSVREDRIRDTDPTLVLSMPKTVDGSQRLRLTVRPAVEENSVHRDLPPTFWSADHVAGLAAAYGGSAARLPGFEPDGGVRPFDAYPTTVDPADPASRAEAFDRHVAAGELVAAWAAAGIDLDPTRPDRSYQGAIDAAAAGGLVPVGLDAELTRLHTRYGVSTAVIGEGWLDVAGVWRRDDGRLTASFVGFDRPQHPQMATVVHDRPADLELVRHGLLDRAELHPLVRQALFPATPAAPAARADRPDLRVSVPVRCQGEWHTVLHVAGRLEPASHTPDEVARERMLRALGGPVSGCFAAVQAWRGSDDRLPRPLRLLRRDVLQRIQHGGSAALTELLDAGLDPRMADGRGGTLLHHMRAVEDDSLIRRLVDAGVPIDAADRRGRTALHVAVGDCGSSELVRALLEAGADPRQPDRDGTTALELADGKASMYYYADYEDAGDPEHPQVRVATVVNDWVNR